MIQCRININWITYATFGENLLSDIQYQQKLRSACTKAHAYLGFFWSDKKYVAPREHRAWKAVPKINLSPYASFSVSHKLRLVSVPRRSFLINVCIVCLAQLHSGILESENYRAEKKCDSWKSERDNKIWETNYQVQQVYVLSFPPSKVNGVNNWFLYFFLLENTFFYLIYSMLFVIPEILMPDAPPPRDNTTREGPARYST